MADELFGIGTDAQLGIIAAVGVALVVAGATMGSSVDAGYDPTVFGIGFVMVLYAGARFVWEQVAG